MVHAAMLSKNVKNRIKRALWKTITSLSAYTNTRRYKWSNEKFESAVILYRKNNNVKCFTKIQVFEYKL